MMYLNVQTLRSRKEPGSEHFYFLEEIPKNRPSASLTHQGSVETLRYISKIYGIFIGK